MNTLSVKFELPTMVASQVGLNFDDISLDVKKMFALFLYEHKHISLSKTCEIGGFSQWEFFEMNRQLGIHIPYTQDNLKEDMLQKAVEKGIIDNLQTVLENLRNVGFRFLL
jgi:predicted HTH domain antitoxin